MATSDTQLIAAVPLFKGLDEKGLDAVKTDARVVRAAAGRTFFREGDAARVFYVLRRGRAKFTQITPEGHEVILRVIGPGEPFGGVAVFVEHTVYPVTARAVEPAEAYAWDGPKMLGLMRRFPEVAINAARLIADRFHELQRQHRELMTERVDGGVEIDFPLSRQDLAQMTGTTLFTVSRTLSTWEEGGLITTGRRRVIVKQPHRLVQIAEDLKT